ncbi:MAG TPA: DUF4199 domain-containing protein [Cyclobacteriaceae bacterium]|nr:DUF4199 domain-containing protein [Cyclobacteriaceae bacterium]
MVLAEKNRSETFFHYIFNYPGRHAEIYGTLIFLGLVIYFLLMWAVGALHVIELRLLNIFILAGGIYGALNQYKRTHRGEVNYFNALTIGIATSVIGVSTFVLFLFIYLLIDEDFMAMLQRMEPMGKYLNPYIATYAVWIEGAFSGLIATFIMCNSMRTKPATKL